MKLDYSASYVSKNADETLSKTYSFSSRFATGEVASSCTITALDADGTSTALISGISVSGQSVSYTLSGGTANETYYLALDCLASGGNTYLADMILEVHDSITLNTRLGDPGANSWATLREADAYIKSTRGHSDVWDSSSMEGRKRVLIQATRDLSKFNFTKDSYYENQALPFPDTSHDIVTGNCATPFSVSGFTNSNLYSTTYGNEMANDNFWKYGTVHITTGTPLEEVRNVNTSSGSTGAITLLTDFSATPSADTGFTIFYPLDEKIKYAQIEQSLSILESSKADALTTYKNMGVKTVEIGDTSVEFMRSSTANESRVVPIAKRLLSKWIKKSLKVLRG